MCVVPSVIVPSSLQLNNIQAYVHTTFCLSFTCWWILELKLTRWWAIEWVHVWLSWTLLLWTCLLESWLSIPLAIYPGVSCYYMVALHLISEESSTTLPWKNTVLIFYVRRGKLEMSVHTEFSKKWPGTAQLIHVNTWIFKNSDVCMIIVYPIAWQ